MIFDLVWRWIADSSTRLKPFSCKNIWTFLQTEKKGRVTGNFKKTMLTKVRTRAEQYGWVTPLDTAIPLHCSVPCHTVLHRPSMGDRRDKEDSPSFTSNWRLCISSSFQTVPARWNQSVFGSTVKFYCSITGRCTLKVAARALKCCLKAF